MPWLIGNIQKINPLGYGLADGKAALGVAAKITSFQAALRHSKVKGHASRASRSASRNRVGKALLAPSLSLQSQAPEA